MIEVFLRRTMVVLIAATSLHAGATDRFISPSVQEQLALPEQEIDVGLAALTIAKEAYPDLDIKTYSAKLDELADKTRWLARGAHDPETRIRALNTVLFLHEGFRYDHEGFAQGGRKEHYHLNGILDTKRGICFTMPLLYVAVAQRLGWPVYPVGAPSHFFVRYSLPAFKHQNIEVTSGGKHFGDEFYIKDFAIGERALKARSYMRTMTYREYLGHLLYASASAFQDGHKRLAYTERAAQLDPRYPNFYQSLGDGYLAKSRIATGEHASQLEGKSRIAYGKAKALGFVSDEMIKAGRSIRGRPQ